MKVKNDQQDAGIELKTLYGILISDQQLIFYQKKKSQMFCQHHLCSLIHEQYHSIFFFFAMHLFMTKEEKEHLRDGIVICPV